MQVKVRSAFAIPHQVHRGREKQAVMVRAVFGFGSQKRDVFDSVAIRWALRLLALGARQ